MHKQQRRHDVRLRGCPTCWLNLSLHGRIGLYAPHVCVYVCVCVQYECVSVHCPIFEKRLMWSLSREAGLLRSVLSRRRLSKEWENPPETCV